MFSAAKGSSGFSFAIANDLYVPVLKGKRIVDAEKWLSGLEDALGAILPIVISGNDIKYEKQMVAVKFLMGLLSLQYRSEYVLSKFREAVEKDAEVQTFLNVHSNRTVDQVIVENIVNSVEETMKSITPTKMRILQPRSGEFIITDHPVIPEDYVGERIIVVAPKVAIALSKGLPSFGYQYVPIDESLVGRINDLLATQARSWIAGSSKAIVQKYAAVVGTEKWNKMKNSEKVHTIPFKQLLQGWEFKQN